MSTPELEKLARETWEKILPNLAAPDIYQNAIAEILAALQRAGDGWPSADYWHKRTNEALHQLAEARDQLAAAKEDVAQMASDKFFLNTNINEYRNLEDQGWYHPDIVNELRAQLAAANERAERELERGERWCAEEIKQRKRAEAAEAQLAQYTKKSLYTKMKNS